MNKRIMTDEAKKALEALLPVPSNGVGFVPSIYPKEYADFAPTVYIRMLTVDELKSREADLNTKDFHDIIAEYSFKAIININNLFDASGNEMPYKHDLEFYKTLPISLIYGIYTEVLGISMLKTAKEADEKESLG